ncbi:hypothetical protein [Saccharothrix sp. HUAS TT1]|uniref:hypothetical protein n=1 Tax=unclassified Saccharothrix TaxID=2593673 RepID=UPI00345C1980
MPDEKIDTTDDNPVGTTGDSPTGDDLTDAAAQDERLAESQRNIDEAKALAADLAEKTPDPLPGGDSAEGTPPGP